MKLEQPERFSLSSWGISLAVHAAAVGMALAFTAQVKPVLQKEIFKWDVALVEAVNTDLTPERAEPATKPTQPMARVTPPPPVEPTPGTVVHRVAPQQTVQMVHPMIEPVKPIEQKVEPSLQVEQKLETPQPKIEPIEQKVVEVPTLKHEPVVEAKEPEPVQHAEPLVAQSQSVAVAPSAEPVESRPPHHEASPPASAASASHQAPTQEAVKTAPAVESVDPPSSGQAVPDAPMQVAKAAAPSSEVKTDHRWLAESLWRRVAELKRYPSSARLNGQEGKVILKAVIRSDGHLAEVSVLKSSGHPILDTAAIEVVKLACPLHMRHAIDKPEIVVSLPIVYSLAN